MKYLVILALCLSAVLADLPSTDLHSSHYSQHSQTVGDAKRIVHEKLGGGYVSGSGQSLEEIDQYGAGTVGLAGGLGSSSSYSSSSGSSQSDTQQVLEEGSLNLGLGIGGGSGSSSYNTAYSSSAGAGPIVIPISGGSGGSESFSEQSERRVEGGGSPVILSSPSGGSESYSHHHESRVQNQAAPIYVSSPSGSESYSHHEERRVQQQAAPVIVAPSGGSESYSHHEERRVQNQAAPVIVAPSGGSESYSHHEERRVQNQAAPVYISSPSGASESYSHHREQRIQQAALPTIYTPSGGASESYSHHRSQRIQSQPIIYSSPSGASESYSHHSEKIVKAQPVPLYIAPSTGSESYSQMRKFSSQSQAAPLVIAPTVGLSSHSSLLNSHLQTLPSATYYPSENSYSRLSESLSNSQTVPTYSTIIAPSGGASEYSYTHKSSKSQASPSVIYTSPSLNSHSSYISSQSSNTGSNLVPIVTGLGTSGALVSSNGLYATNNLNGGLIVPGSSSYGSHSSLFNSGLHSSSNLDRYMTESERLARIQAQDVGFGGFRTGSTQLNLDGTSSSFGGLGSGNLLVGDGGAGYRTKSWEKSSKWASGTQFGSDGRPNNYNLLSTAESENHDINGRQAGYKAATTTVDDNGKVSTYSIHS